jgi:hypothetical protein
MAHFDRPMDGLNPQVRGLADWEVGGIVHNRQKKRVDGFRPLVKCGLVSGAIGEGPSFM